jgi:hypothetical protein
MNEDKATTSGAKIQIKPNTIAARRASRSARKFIRRTKEAARKGGPLSR